ncbi:recombinase family protein [Polaribacter sp. MSW13]|uniref:Recombinase family protein n=1 Tax=Polaribacter marinus TaxID=2916838 RepID=A0A9X1VR06_9FLAO|nr:recombinase family protein [Polaribacter marinus]MCI2230243.1 recombinase family protein [Polaribacter marinus]
MNKYIAYYRVSTKMQGNSGLGLDAQKSSVLKFINDEDLLIESYTDVESGKNNNRPNLLQAIEDCKNNDATLLIAKLDRLSRNAAFIFTLRDTQVKFKCVDMPEANSVTIGIMAVLAQDERERISKRTKDALAELIKQGVKLGSPQNLNKEAREKGLEARMRNARNNENNRKAQGFIISLYQNGLSFYAITKELNKLGYKTRNNKEFQQNQVQRLYDRHLNN